VSPGSFVEHRRRVGRVEVVNGLSDDEWRSLAGTSLYGTPHWSRLAAQSAAEHGAAADYIVARRDDGAAVAALPIYGVTSLHNEVYDPAAAFGSFLADAWPEAGRWLPGILAGGFSGYRTELLLAKEARRDERLAAAEAVLRHCLELIEDRRQNGLWLMCVPPDDAAILAAALASRGLLLLHEVEFDMEIGWKSLLEYVSALPKHRRRTTRAELRSFREHGSSVVCRRLSDVSDQLVPLYAAVLRKYGTSDPEERARTHLARHVAFLDDLSFVVLCERGDQPIGFSLLCSVDDTLYSRVVGFDYGLATHSEYFNLAFYEPIRLATERGFRRLHWGLAAAEAKLRRGARARPLWAVLARPGGVPEDVRASARVYNRDKAERFREEHEAFAPWGLDVDGWDVLPEVA
jgi:predicted N-acyltransferase